MRETGLDHRYGIGSTLSDVATATRRVNLYKEYSKMTTDGLIADTITEKVRSGKMKTHTAEEVYKKLHISLS